jgi:hypothetical protein
VPCARTIACCTALTIVLIFLTCLQAYSQSRSRVEQTRGAFRSRVVLVPIDVRVVDERGNPVADLTERDFTIFEDDVRQDIRHFAAHAFTARRSETGRGATLRRAPGFEMAPVEHRTFLIVMGRGRLNSPGDGLDAMLDFVRDRLLPQDQVGVLAFGWTRRPTPASSARPSSTA